MKYLYQLTIILFLFGAHLLPAQSYDYVTGYGFKTDPDALVALTGDRWLAVCTGDFILGPISNWFPDSVVALVLNAQGEVLLEKRFEFPAWERHYIPSVIGMPNGGFALLISTDHCDYWDSAELQVFDIDGNFLWERNTQDSRGQLKIAPDGNLININNEGLTAYDPNDGTQLWWANLVDSTGATFSVGDIEFLNGQDTILSAYRGWFLRFEKQNDTSYLLKKIQIIDPLFYADKLVRHPSTENLYYAYSSGGHNKLYGFNVNSLDYSLLAEYPFRLQSLVSTGSKLVALAISDSISFLLFLNDQGQILDTIRTIQPLLKGRKLSFQNNRLAIAGINGSGPPLVTTNGPIYNRQQLWFHTNQLNDAPPLFEANATLSDIIQHTALEVISSTINGQVLYKYKGGNFQLQIKNLGDALLETIDVNIGFKRAEPGWCNNRWAKKAHFSGLGLLPNESTWLQFGDILAGGEPSIPDQLCFWVSAPNNQPDSEPGNDIFCKSIFTVAASEPRNTSFSISPNPSSDAIQVSFEGPAETGFWKMCDLTGQVLKSGAISSGTESLNINCENLPATLYLLWVNGAVGKVLVSR